MGQAKPFPRKRREDTAIFSREMDRVTISGLPSKARVTPATLDFQGIRISRIPIGATGVVEFAWCGPTHYLGYHDIELKDGETWCGDGSTTRHLAKRLIHSLTFVPAGERVWGWSDTTARQDAQNAFTALYFNPGAMTADLGRRFDQAAKVADVYFAANPLCESMRKLHNALGHSGHTDLLYVESLALLCGVELCIHLEGKRPVGLPAVAPLDQQRESRVRDYVESHLAEDVGLTELAQVAGLSRFHFVRAFRKQVGETPYQYLLRRRIERARQLLRSDDTIESIAQRVGFNSSTRFIKVFRQLVGRTPGAVRENRRR